MKVLLIHQFFLPPEEAGGQRWNETSRLWATKGHAVTVIAGMVHYGRGRKYAHCRGRWVVEEHPAPGLRVIRTHVSDWYNRNWVGRLWGYATFLASGFWAALFRLRESCDVVLVTSPPLLLGLLGVAVARWKRRPLVTEIRDLWPDAPVQMGVLKNRWLAGLAYGLERWLYRQSDRIVVLTPGFRQVLIEQKGVSPEKIAVLPNAADFHLTDPLLQSFDRAAFRRAAFRRAAFRREEPGHEGGFRVVYAGALGRANRLEPLLEAARLLKDEPVEFLLIGDGMERPQLERRAREAQLTNVRFLPFLPREEAFRCILAADLGVVTMQPQPVFRTMYANKMFEYMAARKPVLMAIDGLSRELIEKAGAGVFVQPDNPDDWAEKIREYVTFPEKGILQGKNGYAYAQAHFDRTMIAQQYLELIQHVSKRR
ncbi:glycosyltransferase family 4 protein [Tellurirhabdus rosea]|uniref:glycosyltransferase family 4 protein n=1 Tax=Tellurirhabdus rosea TaxID=2674997 RepID=UPI0022553916|nr:glycosyltransferase family 4 protein [Tellurirhabdus rosea]